MKRLPYLEVMEFDNKWNVINKLSLRIPGMNYAHDFALFPDYYVFHMTPFANVSYWTALKVRMCVSCLLVAISVDLYFVDRTLKILM